ncbi:ribonuclease PH [Candidatus Dependentiae bacterium]
MFERRDGRAYNCLRHAKVSFNTFGYAAGSVLFELGNTKVLCSASMQNGVPPFLKGKKTGWLTAEYAMLPTSSTNRIVREATLMRKNGRSVEISRLIGRSLRTIVNLDAIGERTIYIDCDVLQADGGTRTACITGACLALRAAQAYWLKRKFIKEIILTDHVAAISVGVINTTGDNSNNQDNLDKSPNDSSSDNSSDNTHDVLLDLSYEEDSIADADFNFVITKSNKIVEIQGGAEKGLITWEQFEKAKEFACLGVSNILNIGDNLFDAVFSKKSCDYSQETKSLENSSCDAREKSKKEHGKKNNKTPFFSLANR